MKLRCLSAVALALCACGSDLASPFSAVAVTYDVNKKSFKLAQVRVNTLASLRHLQGTAGNVSAGGTARVTKAALADAAATVATLQGKFITQPPGEVDLTWSILNDIVYPENFDSLELLSSYYNLEKARKQLADWAPKDFTLLAKPVIAHSTLLDDNGLSPMGDGEIYYPPLAGFYLPAATPKAQVPAALNLGAVAHALGHEAFAELVWGGKPVAAPELGAAKDPDWNTARHVTRSMTEGIADYLGVAVSEDSRWFDHSLQQTADSRALDRVRCGDPSMLEALPASDDSAPYDPYPLGTVLAGALWEATNLTDSNVQTMAKGVLGVFSALKDRSAALAAPGQLTLAVVLDTIVTTADDTVKPNLCGLFFNRFAALSVRTGDLPACNAVVAITPDTLCQ